MDEAFIIMQIGDTTLDTVYEEVFVPAIEETGFAARRVDRHNAGDLLKSEIVQFIERSQIIVADITNERPTVIWRLAMPWVSVRRLTSFSRPVRIATIAVQIFVQMDQGCISISKATIFCSGNLTNFPSSVLS